MGQLNVDSLQDVLNQLDDKVNELKVKQEVEEQKTEWLMGENQKLYYSLDEMNVTLQTQQPNFIFVNGGGNSSATEGNDTVPMIPDPSMFMMGPVGTPPDSASVNASLLGSIQETTNKVDKLMTVVQGDIKRLDATIENFISEDWFNAPNGYQYYLSKAGYKTDSFARSRRYCTYQKAELAHVGMRDAIMYRYLWNNLLGPGNHYCIWIGLTDKLVEGQFKWVDDTSVDDYWTNWKHRGRKPKTGSANALSSLRDCVMIKNGLWEEGNCSGQHQKVCSFVCERKAFR